MAFTDDDKSWLETRFKVIDGRFEEVERAIDELNQKIERVETSLLTEFHKWASPMESRMRTHTALLRAGRGK